MTGASVRATVTAKPTDVVVTREAGKNGQLLQALKAKGVSVMEMPLVETVEGPDAPALSDALKGMPFSWVTITSPEAAAVFLRAWTGAGKPQVCGIFGSSLCLTPLV